MVVVEQTETPEQLKERNAVRKRKGLKMDVVVKREKVAVLSQGALFDAEMVRNAREPAYVLALVEEHAGKEGEKGKKGEKGGRGGRGGNGGRGEAKDPAEAEVVDAGKRADADADADGSGGVVIGACALEVTTGQIIVGQIADNASRSKLKTLLAALSPRELLVPKDVRLSLTGRRGQGKENGPSPSPSPSPLPNRVMRLLARTRDVVKKHCASTQAVTSELVPVERFWTGERALEELASLLGDVATCGEGKGKGKGKGMGEGMGEGVRVWPSVVASMAGDPGTHSAALDAFGGILSFMKDALLDAALVPICQFFQLPENGIPCLACPNEARAGEGGNGSAKERGDAKAGGGKGGLGRELGSIHLDASALGNLEIVENSEGGHEGTLLSQIDQCATGPGHRMLRHWLLHPLIDVQAIRQRQDAIALLVRKGVACDVHAGLKKVPDLERCLTRLGATAAGAGRDASHVVLYEDAMKKRLKAFTSTLRGFKGLCALVSELSRDMGVEGHSGLLGDLLAECAGSAVQDALGEMEEAFDWTAADRQGRIVPTDPSVDSGYAQALADLDACAEERARYLDGERRAHFGASARVCYSNAGGSLTIEVPQSLKGKVPSSYVTASRTKAVVRYTTPALDVIEEGASRAQEEREMGLGRVFHGMVRRFFINKDMWRQAVEAMASLDCLVSLAMHASCPGMCQPSFVEMGEKGKGGAEGKGEGEGRASQKEREGEGGFFHATALGHPAAGPSFVTNDVQIGGGCEEGEGEGAPKFVLLTGPNMGGKSTLMRCVALAQVLAQIGAWVPATRVRLTATDGIYVRMGARDSILTGRSTFQVSRAPHTSRVVRTTAHARTRTRV